MTKIIQITNDTFEAEVLQSILPTLVDFYADWCRPCKALAPVVQEISTELKGQLKVVKLDVDENQKLAVQNNVQAIPTLVLFQDGQEIERFIGFLTKSQLLNQLQPHLNQVAA